MGVLLQLNETALLTKYNIHTHAPHPLQPTHTAFEPLSPFDAAAATDDAAGVARDGQNGGRAGVMVPPSPAAPPLPVAAAEDEALAYNPFFSRLPGDSHRMAAGRDEGEEGGEGRDLCGPVLRSNL